jgi:trimeric autotransporter adhesin
MKPILRALKKILPFVFFTTLFCGTLIVSYAQAIDFGKSYINITKGLNGGTVEPGDTLEIRSSFVVRSGTFDSCGYTDAIPAGTVYIPGTIRVLTNEGKIYQQFTDVINDDCGWITGSTIRINLGYTPAALPATAFRRGRVANTHKPSFYLGACIMIASFRVKVTAALGSNISSGGGSMTYKNGVSPVVTFIFPANIIRVYPNFAICPNTVGVNSIGTETNGTFSSGKPRNRGVSANVPAGYTYNIFDAGNPNDYAYGIANNTSPRFGYTTLNTWAKPDPDPDGAGPLTTHRVFGVWDVIGDHTGAISPTAGNPPADTVANPAAGYMLVVNAAYRIDSAFQQTISSLCPNTYYEISCWMRNICSKCGCDSNGKGAINSAGPPFYIPTAAGDSSGVYPNITFDIDGIDYYSTGNILYKGQWVKKGFTFLTGPVQTSFTLKFFNNAPGGGGNDWALDDISVATCSPNMKYSPSVNPNICRGNPLILFDTVRSFFNNYTFYKWQRSTDNGLTWADVTPPSGPAIPIWNGTAWEYVTTYTVPPANTQPINNADQYRMVVATTSSNLSDPNCRFTDNGNIITIHIINCGPPLGIQMMSFAGRLNNGNSELNWTMGRESQAVFYDIERSTDGSNFILVGTVNSYGDYNNELNTYSYTDPAPPGVIYYRIKLKNSSEQFAYTRTIQLSSHPTKFSLSVINPFNQQLRFDVMAVRAARADVELVDASGQVRRRTCFELLPGTNRLSFMNTDDLSTGIYILRIQSEGVVLQKTVLKQTK